MAVWGVGAATRTGAGVETAFWKSGEAISRRTLSRKASAIITSGSPSIPLGGEKPPVMSALTTTRRSRTEKTSQWAVITTAPSHLSPRPIRLQALQKRPFMSVTLSAAR